MPCCLHADVDADADQDLAHQGVGASCCLHGHDDDKENGFD